MAKIDQQVAVVKSLVGDQLNPKQLEELLLLSDIDLMTEHGLNDVEAQKVLTHAKREMYRMRAQGYSFGTLNPEERAKVSYPHPPTSTSPVYEARAKRGKRLAEARLRQTIKQTILKESPMAGAMPLVGIGALSAAPMSARPTVVPASTPGRDFDYREPKEGGMMRSNLYNIAQDAMALCDMLQDDDNLPQWTQEKVATARDRLNSVREYLEAKIYKHKG